MAISYAIVGTGALGGYYGGQLAKSGRRVHFLLNSDYEHVREHGLRVDTPDDAYTIKPDTHDVTFHGHADDLPAADVVLICLKTTHNHLLSGLLPEPGGDRWKPGTLVVTLQNGLHPERDAAAVVGEEHVAGGLCFLCSNKVGPGHISYLDYGFIKLGSHVPGTHRERLEQIAADFQAADVKCDVVDDLVEARWKKLVWNVPYNGLSVVLNLTTDQMMADPDVRQRVVALMHEVAAAAQAVDGKTIDEAFIQNMLDYTAQMAPYKTSMMLDHEAGRPMEIEAIVGDPYRAGASERSYLPEMEFLYRKLLRKQFGVEHYWACSKIDASFLIDRVEVRLRQDQSSGLQQHKTCEHYRRICDRLRTHIAKDELKKEHWVGLWRGFADGIAPPESGRFVEFMALLAQAQVHADHSKSQKPS